MKYAAGSLLHRMRSGLYGPERRIPVFGTYVPLRIRPARHSVQQWCISVRHRFQQAGCETRGGSSLYRMCSGAHVQLRMSNFCRGGFQSLIAFVRLDVKHAAAHRCTVCVQWTYVHNVESYRLDTVPYGFRGHMART